jgi:hypothetical protein
MLIQGKRNLVWGLSQWDNAGSHAVAAGQAKLGRLRMEAGFQPKPGKIEIPLFFPNLFINLQPI